VLSAPSEVEVAAISPPDVAPGWEVSEVSAGWEDPQAAANASKQAGKSVFMTPLLDFISHLLANGMLAR